MNTNYYLWVIVSILCGALVWLFSSITPDMKSTLNITIALGILQVGACWYFLSSLKTFKRAWRIAYYMLSAGILLFGFTELQLPAIVIFSLWEVPVFALLPIVTYLASALLIYLSMRKLAQILTYKPRLASVSLVGILSVGVMIGLLFLPIPLLPPEARFSAGLVAVGAVFFGAAAWLAWHISKLIGGVYITAMRWLTAGLALLAAATLHELVVKSIWPEGWYTAYGISLWPYLVASALILRAGISYKKSSASSAGFLASENIVDAVISLAALASNPRAFDTKLDEVRRITASQTSSSALSPNDKKILLKTFLSIEEYLVTSDPARNLTKDEIRLNLPDSVLRDLEAYEAKSSHANAVKSH